MSDKYPIGIFAVSSSLSFRSNTSEQKRSSPLWSEDEKDEELSCSDPAVMRKEEDNLG